MSDKGEKQAVEQVLRKAGKKFSQGMIRESSRDYYIIREGIRIGEARGRKEALERMLDFDLEQQQVVLRVSIWERIKRKFLEGK